MKQTVPDERSARTLHEALAAFERSLNSRAGLLDRKRYSKNNQTHWKARGSQEVLRRAAKHLWVLRREYHSSCALHRMLGGYVLCLEKCSGDAQEEKNLPVPKRGMAVVQWKAQGEYQVLPGICVALTTLLAAYTPESEVVWGDRIQREPAFSR